MAELILIASGGDPPEALEYLMTKEETKALRKRIREADDIVEILQELARDYQFRMDCQWGVAFPLADILIGGAGEEFQCLFPGMGQRNYRSVKALSYAIKFSRPQKYCGIIHSDDRTGVHDYTD